MAEFIDREAALEECDWYANEFCECEYAIMPLKGALEILPAADVRPVRRGKWEKADGAYCGGFTEDGDSITLPTVRCSVCKKLIAPVIWKNFCPNCGADMREES